MWHQMTSPIKELLLNILILTLVGLGWAVSKQIAKPITKPVG